LKFSCCPCLMPYPSPFFSKCASLRILRCPFLPPATVPWVDAHSDVLILEFCLQSLSFCMLRCLGLIPTVRLNAALCLKRLQRGAVCLIRQSFCSCRKHIIFPRRYPAYSDDTFPAGQDVNDISHSSSSCREQCCLPSFCRAVKPFVQTIRSRDAVSTLNDS